MASPNQRLRELERSEVFAADFPRRCHLTHAQWAGLSEDERREARSPASIAIRRAKNTTALAELIKEIGRAKQANAVPLLVRIWSDCALEPVRIAAGHALRAVGSDEARAALGALIEDADHMSVFVAVRAVFDDDPAAAFDRFAPYFEKQRLSRPGGHVIPEEVLQTFAPAWQLEQRAEGPRWTMGESGLLQEDGRWIDLCVRLRHDSQLGRAARTVLRVAEPERVREMLSRARATEGPRVVRWHSTASGDLLARYCRGEHDAVWSELRIHQAINEDCRAEAIAVATETMRRVARGADLLADRLASRGWSALTRRLRWPPSADNSRTIDDIERFTGAPLPVSLRAFWERVGGIDFCWNYDAGEAPDFGLDVATAEMDPLCVFTAEDTASLLSEWRERRSNVDPDLDDPWELDLAPDYLHKADISGGAPYGVELPFLGADPIFVNEGHGLPFVEYLRLAFRWGGFPRLERHAHNVNVRKFVAAMTKDVESF